MRKFFDTPTPAQVYRFAVDFCQPHLDFHTVGKGTATILVMVLPPPRGFRDLPPPIGRDGAPGIVPQRPILQGTS